ncbi:MULTISPECIES: hypothetical protein [Serratia]|uniref:hypothetical protein n=1 Tax=Serratia TaxID=613 RepID=UPI0014959B2B|nr:hypothetical protein [Serratia marcescens]BEN24895.1 hypothetical protein SMKC032_09900 [Serratia marcescens]
MKLYINDCSFQGQAKSKDEAVDILMELAKAFHFCKTFACPKKSSINEEMKNKKIWGDKTIIELFHEMKGVKDSQKKQAILQVFCSRPHYNSKKHTGANTIKSSVGDDLKGTCFDSAAISKCGAIVVSASKSENYSENTIEVVSSISGQRKIINVCEYDDAKNLKWIYEANPKHGKKPKDVGRFIISQMDLSDEDAQAALTNGVYINKKVISKYNDRWYCFPYHSKPYYHGYMIEFKSNEKIHGEVIRILERVSFEKRGQIFHGYC